VNHGHQFPLLRRQPGHLTPSVRRAELLEGKTIDAPPLGQASVTFKKAPRAKEEGPEQLRLGDE
jgi:hypothetical protein